MSQQDNQTMGRPQLRESDGEGQHLDSQCQENSAQRNTNPKEIYEETCYRWYILVAYFLLTFANGLQWVTFSSCGTDFGEVYGMKSWKVNMFSLIYMIIYPFVCIPEGYLVDAYSTRLGLIIAASCTLAGSGLKCLVNKSMPCVFIGQILSGLFQPAILNSPGKIAANWFRENIRTVICTICCISDSIGILVGFVFHIPFIDENDTPDVKKDQYFHYLLGEFILNIVFCIPTFFIFKNKPDVPPSPTQVQQEKPGLLESLKLLFTNTRFIYLLLATCFFDGYYNIYSTILNSYLYIYEISDNEASWTYFVANILGIISSLIVSALVDKYKKFKLTMILLAIIGTIFQALFTLLLEISLKHEKMNQFAMAMVMYTLVNMLVIPFYTIGMNYACEITYPVGESINGGLMMSISQISGIAGSFGCDALINDYKDAKYASNIVLLIFFVISTVFVFLFDEKLDRYEIDKKGIEQKELKERNQQNEDKKENENGELRIEVERKD